MVGGSLLYLEEPEWNRWNRWTRWTNAEVDRKVTWTNRATLRVFTPGEADRGGFTCGREEEARGHTHPAAR